MRSPLIILAALCVAPLSALAASITVSSAPTTATPTGTTYACTSACNVNAAALATLLDTTDVKLDANTTGSTIVVSAAVTWAGVHALTLEAAEGIVINAAVTGRGEIHAGARCGSPGAVTGSGSLTGSGSGTEAFAVLSQNFAAAPTFNASVKAYTLVDDVTELAAITNDRDYALNCDIDASTVLLFTPITQFNRTLDGRGHAVLDLKFDGGSYAGIFESLDAGSIVRNLVLVRPNVRSQDYAGALVGFQSDNSVISDVIVLGIDLLITTGSAYAGGIAGVSVYGGVGKDPIITRSYVSGKIGCDQEECSVGGIAGVVTLVEDVAVKADITSRGPAGIGLYGSDARIQRVWSAGTLTTINPPYLWAISPGDGEPLTSAYYDATRMPDAYDAATSSPRTSAQMLQQATYAGFDFTNTWSIMENVGQPYLASMEAAMGVDVTLTAASASADISGDFVMTATVAARQPWAPVTGFVDILDGTTIVGTGALTAGSASITVSGLAIGAHPLRAAYRGDDFHIAWASATATVNVNGPTTTTFTASTTTATYGDAITLTATVSSGSTTPTGSVNFVGGGNVLVSAPLVDGVATANLGSLAVGVSSVTAVYVPAVDNFAASESTAIAFTINAAPYPFGFTLNVTPAAATVTAGDNATFGLQLTPSAGSIEETDVTFSCSGLPSGAACTFAPAQAHVTAAGAASQLTITTSSATAAAGPLMPLPPPGAWLALVSAAALALVMSSTTRLRVAAATASLALMAACGSDSSDHGTSPVSGTYTVTIRATSSAGALTSDVTLTIQE